MEQQMFCYQCEQTAGCSGCVGNIGVCGKSADVANLQDKLTGALIGLARATEGKTTGEQGLRAETFRMIIEGLFATITNVSFDAEAIQNMIDKVEKEKNRLSPGCSACGTPCGKTNDYTLDNLWQAEEDIRSLKSLILFGIRGMAAYAYHALMLGYTDEEINLFFCEALYKIGYEEIKEELLPTVLRVGEINLKC
ncbi:MAG: hydroxylamine reductase, partial [Lachnospiraceae bacterium]|nr:hydroxylamine reductase [Lachnospiraceae bacterium]